MEVKLLKSGLGNFHIVKLNLKGINTCSTVHVKFSFLTCTNQKHFYHNQTRNKDNRGTEGIFNPGEIINYKCIVLIAKKFSLSGLQESQFQASLNLQGCSPSGLSKIIFCVFR